MKADATWEILPTSYVLLLQCPHLNKQHPCLYNCTRWKSWSLPWFLLYPPHQQSMIASHHSIPSLLYTHTHTTFIWDTITSCLHYCKSLPTGLFVHGALALQSIPQTARDILLKYTQDHGPLTKMKSKLSNLGNKALLWLGLCSASLISCTSTHLMLYALPRNLKKLI